MSNKEFEELNDNSNIEIKNHLKNFSRLQGFVISDKLFSIIMELAEELGIYDIAGLSIFYTVQIMPMLEPYCCRTQSAMNRM